MAGAPRQVEWVQITTSRRIGYGLGALVMLLIFAGIAWLDLQAGKTGLIDTTIMGATLAGGGFAAFFAVTGKEQRKIKRA
jgi:hypothetical protein